VRKVVPVASTLDLGLHLKCRGVQLPEVVYPVYAIKVQQFKALWREEFRQVVGIGDRFEVQGASSRSRYVGSLNQ